MSAEESYVGQVIGQLPRAPGLRSQVAMELRSHIAERVDHGYTLDDTLRQLGNPITLAESYVQAIPLVPASFWRRGAAKIVDILAFACAYVPVAWLVAQFAPVQLVQLAVIAAIAFFAIGCTLYLIIAEYRFGETLGKHLLGLQVVRESGTRISLGQSVVRQLPMFLQVGWVDVLFALFTERHQRAFELLSKTRVVQAME
jgi:uncharacterized RDD family membrane protein YckC